MMNTLNDKNTGGIMENLIIVGAPGAGKTSYTALSLSCIFHISQNEDSFFSLTSWDTSNENRYLALWAHQMQKGEWPDKTQNKVEGQYDLKYDVSCFSTDRYNKSLSLRLIDLPGELCRMSCLGTEAADEIEAKIKQTQFFFLVMDARDVLEERDHEYDFIDVIRGVLYMLKLRAEKQSRFYLAVIFSKCDSLDPQHYPEARRLEILTEQFKSKFAGYMSKALQGRRVRYFCVSCLPNQEHRSADVMRGQIANKGWSTKDMIDQLGPWEWFLGEMGCSLFEGEKMRNLKRIGWILRGIDVPILMVIAYDLWSYDASVIRLWIGVISYTASLVIWRLTCGLFWVTLPTLILFTTLLVWFVI